MKNIYEFYEKNCEIVMKKWQEKGQPYTMIGNSNFPSLSKKDSFISFLEKWCWQWGNENHTQFLHFIF